MQHVLELRRGEFENQWRQRRDSLESHKQICVFDSQLQQINESIDDVGRQIKDLKGQYGDSVSTAKATSQTFGYFEKTIEVCKSPFSYYDGTAAMLYKISGYVSVCVKLLQYKTLLFRFKM